MSVDNRLPKSNDVRPALDVGESFDIFSTYVGHVRCINTTRFLAGILLEAFLVSSKIGISSAHLRKVSDGIDLL